MGMIVLIIIVLLCVFCSWLVARPMYKRNVRENYKNPWLAPVLVFIIMLAIMLFLIYQLLDSMFQR